jgi:transposase
MSKIRKTYTSEFKREALRLRETSGKSAAQIERDLGVGPGCLSRWKHQVSQDGDAAFPGHGRVMPEQEWLRQLEHENAVLRQERDILKKAVAIFSRPKG